MARSLGRSSPTTTCNAVLTASAMPMAKAVC